MRKWFAIAALLLVGIVGLLALAVVNLDRWLNANKELVAQQVETALGREVSFGEVGLSFSGGLGVRVTDLRVGDDPEFSQQDFVRSQAVDVLIRIWPALFGDIEVERVVLRGPELSVVRTAQGLSTDSLGGGGAGEAPTEAGPEPALASEAPERALLVALVDIRDGTLRYADHSQQPPLEVEVTQLDLHASDIRPGEPVAFELDAAVLGSAQQNFGIAGSVGPVGADVLTLDLSLTLAPVAAEKALALAPLRDAMPAGLVASGPLELELEAKGSPENLHFDTSLDAGGAAVTLGESFDKPRGVPLRLALRGTRGVDSLELERIELRFDAAEIGGKAKLSSVEKTRGEFAFDSPSLPLATFGAGEAGEELRDVSLQGSLAGPKISATLRSPAGSLRGSDYEDLEAVVASSGGRIEIEKASFRAWGGAASTTGTYDASAAQPRFDLRTQVEKVRVEQLLANSSPGLARVLSGELNTQLGMRGSGAGWEEIRPLLSGDGDLRLSDGLLRDFNAAGDAARAIAALPPLAGSGISSFITAHPQVFGAEDTAFEELFTELVIRDGWVALPGFLLGAKEYELRGAERGRLSLAGDLDLPLDVVLSSALSQDALAAAKPLRYLKQPDGRVALPLLLRGMPPTPSLDPETVSRLALRAGSALLVEKLLGSPREEKKTPETEVPEDTAATADSPAAADADPNEDPATTSQDELIQEGLRGLEGLLGGQKR